MPGMTFFTPIAAVLNTPQRTFFSMRSIIAARRGGSSFEQVQLQAPVACSDYRRQRPERLRAGARAGAQAGSRNRRTCEGSAYSVPHMGIEGPVVAADSEGLVPSM